MQLRIADTFTDSLAKLTCEEQKAVKTTAFDLQLSPANPGMNFHKLNTASSDLGVSSGLAMPHILAGGNPARVTASHGPGIEPCSQSGDGLVDA